jgi:D,D-heptose 1,7-bisphosphate phosphatase
VTRAIFIDRDGTINVDKDYLTDLNQIEFEGHSPEAIAAANRLGFKVIVISNQSGVARGLVSAAEAENVNNRLVSMLKERGAIVDAIYYCPHYPENNQTIRCACRKPDIGMLLRAKEQFDIDLPASFVVGDKWSGVKCGENAGATTSLVLTGYAKTDYQRCIDDRIKIDYLADNLFDFVNNFVKKELSRRDSFGKKNN